MQTPASIFLFTDFGSADIYVGQVTSVLHACSRGALVIDLLNDAPSFDVEAAAHLLAALAARLPHKAVTLAVVDPGVGSARDAVAVEADGRWYVGPDNGLMSVVAGRAAKVRCFSVSGDAPPESVSFHGRDLFAPVAAAIASGAEGHVPGTEKAGLDVTVGSSDLARIVYVDHYGNAMTGLRASMVDARARIAIAGREVRRARVFSEVAPGELFWYANSIGLVEIAANRSSAARLLALELGQSVRIEAS